MNLDCCILVYMKVETAEAHLYIVGLGPGLTAI